MHETSSIELELKEIAKRLSEKYGGVPIVIIAAGSTEHKIPRTMTSSYASDGTLVRLRDLLGILEASKQLETLKHMHLI
jgi:hypothetical protein